MLHVSTAEKCLQFLVTVNLNNKKVFELHDHSFTLNSAVQSEVTLVKSEVTKVKSEITSEAKKVRVGL